MYTKIQPNLFIGFSQLIRRFYVFYKKEINELDIKEMHASMVHLIFDHEGLTQQQLADLTMMKRSSISEIMSEMVKENLIERRKDPKDKRLSRIYLTDHGRRKARKIKDYFELYCIHCCKDFSEEEIQQFQLLISKFNYK